MATLNQEMTKRYDNDIHERPLGQLIAHLKNEARDFLQTRIEMLVSEFHENIADSRKATILGGVALLLLGSAYLLFVLALVGFVAGAFAGNPYAWSFGLLIVGLVWAVFGVLFAVAAKNDFHGIFPKRTIQVLKDDAVLLKHEAGSQA
jgi:uncharacterized membrane protein YqjE